MSGNTIDRIDALVTALFNGDLYHDRAENGERLAEELQALLPVLRFWLEAEDQYDREKGLANTPVTTISKCRSADEALREALRHSDANLLKAIDESLRDGAEIVKQVEQQFAVPGKIKIRIDDPETRAVWETAQKAKAEVARWPAWKRGESATWCPQCGPRVSVDEDGCCVSCGSTAVGEGANLALRAIADVDGGTKT